MHVPHRKTTKPAKLPSLFDVDARRAPDDDPSQQETLPGFYASDGKFVLLPGGSEASATPAAPATPERAS